ncbi:GatB/GatE catalytic domain-containing protein [Lipomyces oligophaga]|uniref:GatB/GatE catalytic domain-containing protein n=1 Tax=Lipomyces oligophaga TaxID=45792 RepID=UPI0034CFFF05
MRFATFSVFSRKSIIASSGCRKYTSNVRAISKYPGLKCGLEIHVQLSTNKKLFSASETSFQADPNLNVSLYDAAIPGTQPILNNHAVLLALRAATALECDIHPKSSFDRKHYFYADQPAGYQITQFYHPIASKGHLRLLGRDRNSENSLEVGITQIQLEQDTGKSSHTVDSDSSFIDFNRTNHPLIEIITEPDIKTPADAAAFIYKLQLILKHYGVSTGQFESGAMRVDVNVSVDGGQRCEIKNLASPQEASLAIIAEYNRQLSEKAKGTPVTSHTLGWNGSVIRVQRPKENASEYRYIPDPELPPLILSSDLTSKVRQNLQQSPDAFIDELMAPPEKQQLKDARVILRDGLCSYYYAVKNIVASKRGPTGKIASWISDRVVGILEPHEVNVLPQVITPERLADIIILESTKVLSKLNAKNLIAYMFENQMDSRSIEDLIKHFSLQNEDDSELKALCEEVLDERQDLVEKFITEKAKNVKNFLVGQVVKKAGGRSDAQRVKVLLDDLFVSKYGMTRDEL